MTLDIRDLSQGIEFALDFTADVDVPKGYGLTNDFINIHAVGKILKLKNQYIFSGDANTTLVFECNRCLKKTSLDLDFSFEEVYSENSNSDEDSDETWIIEDHEIDLAKALYINMLINIPPKVICREDCKGLCISCGKDLNEGECSCDNSTIDTRFLKLYSLFENKEV